MNKLLFARLIIWMSILCATANVAAESQPVNSIPSDVSILQAIVQSNTSLDEEQKAQANARLNETLAMQKETADTQQSLHTLREVIHNAPDQLAALKLEEQQNVPSKPDLENVSISELDALLITMRSELATQQSLLGQREEDLNDLLNQSRSDADELTDRRSRLSELKAQNKDAHDDNLMSKVDALWRKTQITLQERHIDLISLRQENIDLLTELTRRERDQLSATVETLKEQLATALKTLQTKRQEAASSLASKSNTAAADQPEHIRLIQQGITQLTQEQTDLLSREAEFQRQLEQNHRMSEQLKRDYERIRQIVALGGANTQVSNLLQKKRQLAPLPKQLLKEALIFQQLLSNANLRQLQLDEILQQAVATKVVKFDLVDNQGVIERNLQELHHNAALTLWRTYTRYLNILAQLESNTRALAQESEQYHAFIDNRLLWLPSADILPLNQIGLLWQDAIWFTDPQQLKALSDSLANIPSSRLPFIIGLILVVLTLLGLRRRAIRQLRHHAELVRKVRTDSFHSTLMVFAYTLILSSWLGLLLLGFGWILGSLPSSNNTILILSACLQAAGHIILFLSLLRHLGRDDGLAKHHLYWPPKLAEETRRQATWLMPILTPLACLAAAGSPGVPTSFITLWEVVQMEDASVILIGRLAFIAQMLFIALSLYQALRKGGNLMQDLTQDNVNQRWVQYHLFWFWGILAIPVALAIQALLGYFYGAIFLASVIGETLWFLILTLIIRDLIIRSLYVTQRRLRLQEALRYRDEMQARKKAEAEQENTKEVPDEIIQSIEEEKINYGSLGAQATSLVQLGFTVAFIMGIWLIWQDIFPAFSFLNKVELPLTTTKLIEGVNQEMALTLSDVFAGLLLGGLALFAAMKIPAMLELTLLQQLPLSRASRYAVKTISQYIVAIIGVIITFKSLGLQWSSIQWLIAALSVGFGFGLQEIVANFVSGIILLFEQPIRVGDVVTVDGTTGTVSKIRIRATTIVNWDRQELVIPNKTFITGQLINWTLSDTVNRTIITVGVDYGTDTRKAMQLLKDAATEQPNVMENPEPLVSFERFNDNSLDLTLRAYLENLDNRLLTITDLHQRILDKFRAENIEISFPQRDVHLSTTSPLELRVQRT